MAKDSDEFDDDLEDFMEVDDEMEFDTDFGEDLEEPDEEHDDVMLSSEETEEAPAKTAETPTAEEGEQAAEEEPAEKEEAPAAPPPPMPAEELQPIDLEQTPVHVVVEVGRLPMSVSQLVKLEAGNVLDLKVKPENGVDLVINNRLVGRGELVQIGDVIGVRVLETAK